MQELTDRDFTYKELEFINPGILKYSFELPKEFIEEYKNKIVNWTPLGYITYKRSYARDKEDGTREEWYETIKRVIETVYTIQKWYIHETTGSSWSERKAIRSAKEMYEKMFTFKFLPAGRGLFGMNKELLAQKGGSVLFNCAAVSSENIDFDFAVPFIWTMMMSFLGVGVGFDTLGQTKNIKLKVPKLTSEPFLVPDSKEGWTQALEILLRSYTKDKWLLPEKFDYSAIRKPGEKIKTFGGIAPGAGPLKKMISRIQSYLDKYVKEDKTVDSTLIVDIMTAIGEAVVSGGVRRTALLGLGKIDDQKFLNLKNYKDFGDEIADKPRWAANNSINVTVGTDYSSIIENILQNGEPGLIWMDNAKKYSRMKDLPDNKDINISLVNPCVTGDSEIWVADGRGFVSFKDLAINKKDVPVMCLNHSGKLIVKKMINPRITGKNKQVYKITLDDGTFYKTTDNHKFLTISGEYITVKNLQVGDSIKVAIRKQESLQNTTKQCWKTSFDNTHKLEHRIISEYQKQLNNKEKIDIPIQCVNCGRIFETAYNMREIEVCPSCRRKDNYSKNTEQYKLKIKEYFMNRRKNIQSQQSEVYNNLLFNLKREPSKTEWVQECKRVMVSTKINKVGSLFKSFNDLKEYASMYNHKIVSIEYLGKENVYNGTVEDNHNYFIRGQGVNDITKQVFVNTLNCGEIGLESYGLCNLVEVFLPKHESNEEFKRTLKYAYLYGKTVTLLKTHSLVTNSVIMKTRRIGVSVSGITQAIDKFGYRQLMNMLDKGYSRIEEYDKIYSEWFGIPLSIKKTTVKPSGCQVRDSLIITNKGIYRLDELGNINGDTWQDISHKNLKNNMEKEDFITKFYVNGVSPTKKFNLLDASCLESTIDHKYLIYMGDPAVFNINNAIWKKASDIQIGDYFIEIIGGYNSISEPELDTDIDVYCNCKKILYPKKMTPKLAWLLGLIYGDGSVHKGGLRISFNRKEVSLVKFISDTVKELFNIDVLVDDNNDIYINSVPLLKYLKKNNLLKEYSHKLVVPKLIRMSSKESILAFITGLWRADGGIMNRTGWTICTVSEEFARQIQIMGKAIGLFLSISNAGPGGWGSRDRWILNKRNYTDWDIYKHTALSDRYRIHKINDNQFYQLNPCVSIEDYSNYTYDIEVSDSHSYLANNVISHNSVSLVANTTPGVHFPHSEYYYRTIRIQKSSPLIQVLESCGYHIEDDVVNKEYSKVVYFPIKEENFMKAKNTVSIWEQLKLTADMQAYWSDNLVSVTVTFNKSEGHDLKRAIEMFEDRLKGVSFLPIKAHGYKQAPYQEITKEEYENAMKSIKEFNLANIIFDTTKETREQTFCESDKCSIVDLKDKDENKV